MEQNDLKKMVLGLVFPVEEEEKTNPNHKQIAHFLQATTELCLELLSGDFRLPVSSLCMDQKRNGEEEGEMHFGSLKKKGKTSKQNVLT